MEKRVQIPETMIQRALLDIEDSTNKQLLNKGFGTYASRHEILGSVCEEYYELVDAVKSKSLEEVKRELLDIATACHFGVACINSKTLDW